MVDRLHGNAGGILAVAFFKQLYHLLASVILRRVEVVQLPCMCAQLLHYRRVGGRRVVRQEGTAVVRKEGRELGG